MSCRKSNSMQLTHLTFLALFISFLILSCQPEEPLLEVIPIPPDIDVTQNDMDIMAIKQNNNINTGSLQNVMSFIEMEKTTRELILNTFFGTYLFPQLRGFTTSQQADTRVDCPEALLTSGTGTIMFLTLTYGSCTTVSGSVYDGVVTVEISDQLDKIGTTVTITPSSDFTISGENNITGSILMTYTGSNTYEVSSISLTNTNTGSGQNAGTDTQVTSNFDDGVGGEVTVTVVGTNNDPLDLVDDIFSYRGATLKVFCPEGTELIARIGDTPIDYTLGCGVPNVGEIILEKFNVDQDPYAEIDLSYSSSTPAGGCDNLAGVTLDENPFIIIEVAL